MKRIVLLLLIVFSMNSLHAQYKPVDKGSSLTFVIKNLGFGVNGTFSGFQGSINFDTKDVTKAGFDITIDANTVNTDNNMRDQHLKEDSYFDVKKYPTIHFTSTKVAKSGGGYTVTGKLTIKNKAQDISFPFTATSSGDDIVFKGSFKINRKDFDVGGTSTIANELEVTLNVLAKKA
jgi:polyisoprenoid-binding protein YceI